jgi:hypothetical protein
MVLLTQLAFLGAFGYSATKIVGQWYRFRSKNEGRLDDTSLFQVGKASHHQLMMIRCWPIATDGMWGLTRRTPHRLWRTGFPRSNLIPILSVRWIMELLQQQVTMHMSFQTSGNSLFR